MNGNFLVGSRCGMNWLLPILLLSCFGSCELYAGTFPRQASDLSPQARSALAANAKAMNVVDLKYSIEFDYEVKGLPRPVSREHSFYFEQGRYHNEYLTQFPSGDLPQRMILAYDGDVFYHGSATGDGYPVLHKFLGVNEDDERAARFRVSFRYLEAAGFHLPEYISGWKNAVVTSNVLRLADIAESIEQKSVQSMLQVRFLIPEPAVEAAKKVNLDELATQMGMADPGTVAKAARRYQWLRSQNLKRSIEFTLDPAKGYAVTRRVDRTGDGKLIQEMVAENFRSTGIADLWLPGRCTTRKYLRDAAKLEGFTSNPDTIVLTLEDMSFEKRRNMDFTVSYGPGSMVADRSTEAAMASPDGQVDYIVPADSATLRGISRSVRNRRIFFLVLSLLLFGSITAWYFWKRSSDPGDR